MFNEVSLLVPQAVRLFVSEVTWGCGNGPGVAQCVYVDRYMKIFLSEQQ